MSRRLVIITEIISPYRIPLFNALAQYPEVEPHVVFLAENDPTLRQWRVYKDEIRFSYEVLPSFRMRVGAHNLLLNRKVSRALANANPHAILCGGYNYLASWQALRWARNHGCPFFLWSESNERDQRSGNSGIELLKRNFWRRCNGFIVPGRAAFNYLRLKGIPESLIFTAVNAIDNDFFRTAAEQARQTSGECRNHLSLPSRYFLFAGRLVREKGVFELLSAYSKLDVGIRERIGLVFVGDGMCRQVLEAEASSISPGEIRFAGFVQRENLAAYYALAEVSLLPTHSDTWGLVVNEAMACRLPVIVSEAAGCAPDLVLENENGEKVPVGDIDALTAAMRKFAVNPELRKPMGVRSEEIIAQYSPQHWCTGIADMMRNLGESL